MLYFWIAGQLIHNYTRYVHYGLPNILSTQLFSPEIVGREEQLKKEQANLYPVSRFMKDDASDIQEDSAAEDKFYSLDELHILDMIEQLMLRGPTGSFCLSPPYSNIAVLQRQSHAKDNEIKNLKEQLSMKSNVESLQLKAAVDSWNAIVTDVRNKIAFLRTQYNEQINKVKQGFALSTLPPIQLPPPPPSPEILVAGIAWTVPAPVGEAVPPSTGLGSDLPMRNWEKITERLKTAFPQQTRKELTDFLRKLKDTHGKSLSGLTFDEIVNKISQFIDPKRSQANAAQPSKPAWKPLSSKGPATWEGANNLDDEEEEEEPCVICHENLSPENLSVLPCAHKFHSQTLVDATGDMPNLQTPCFATRRISWSPQPAVAQDLIKGGDYAKEV
ncbi:hypothetical protein CB1_001719009 [Camelus ferus]|nr:hypothetical protein CB1_001719009 [Camelus ferus]